MMLTGAMKRKRQSGPSNHDVKVPRHERKVAGRTNVSGNSDHQQQYQIEPPSFEISYPRSQLREEPKIDGKNACVSCKGHFSRSWVAGDMCLVCDNVPHEDLDNQSGAYRLSQTSATSNKCTNSRVAEAGLDGNAIESATSSSPGLTQAGLPAICNKCEGRPWNINNYCLECDRIALSYV